MPMNPWARDADMKELGRLSERNWLQGLGAFTMAPFSRMLDWSKDEIEVCFFLSSLACLLFPLSLPSFSLYHPQICPLLSLPNPTTIKTTPTPPNNRTLTATEKPTRST